MQKFIRIYEVVRKDGRHVIAGRNFKEACKINGYKIKDTHIVSHTWIGEKPWIC